MYNVLTMGTKEDRVHIRIREDLKEDLRVVAELRGLKMSQLLHTLIVKAIQEEKRNDSTEFERIRRKLRQESPSGASKSSTKVRKVS